MKLLLGLLGVPLLVLLALRIYNGPDEPASESAKRWSEPYANTAPDADNAWLLLAGLGAAEDDDPIALGRRRLDAYEQRLRLGPDSTRDAALKQLFEDPLPEPAWSYDTRYVTKGCPRRDTDCIEWAERLRSQLDWLEAASAVRLLRYERALDLRYYESAATPSSLEVQPDVGISTAILHLDLIARDLAAGQEPAQALDRLLRVAGFWRRAAEQGRTAGNPARGQRNARDRSVVRTHHRNEQAHS